MGQAEKARQIAAEHQFSVVTSANVEEVLAVLDAAASASATGGLKGSIARTGLAKGSSGFDSAWVFKGPGGVMKVMDFGVKGIIGADGSMTVSMTIGNFKYQKGPLFTKPSLNGGPVIRRFGDIVVQQLGGSLPQARAGR